MSFIAEYAMQIILLLLVLLIVALAAIFILVESKDKSKGKKKKGSSKTVSREEYNSVRDQLNQSRNEVKKLKSECDSVRKEYAKALRKSEQAEDKCNNCNLEGRIKKLTDERNKLMHENKELRGQLESKTSYSKDENSSAQPSTHVESQQNEQQEGHNSSMLEEQSNSSGTKGEVKTLGLNDLNSKESEPKESEPKESESNESEPKEPEPKEPESKELEPKEPEPKKLEKPANKKDEVPNIETEKPMADGDHQPHSFKGLTMYAPLPRSGGGKIYFSDLTAKKEEDNSAFELTISKDGNKATFKPVDFLMFIGYDEQRNAVLTEGVQARQAQRVVDIKPGEAHKDEKRWIIDKLAKVTLK